MTDAPNWIFCDDRLPELNEGGWSDYVQLAYKVAGCQYRGLQMVSRYHRHWKTGEMVWDYQGNSTLSEYGYEAVAWMPLLPGPQELQP